MSAVEVLAVDMPEDNSAVLPTSGNSQFFAEIHCQCQACGLDLLGRKCEGWLPQTDTKVLLSSHFKLSSPRVFMSRCCRHIRAGFTDCIQGLISGQSTEIVGSDYPMAFTGQFIFFTNESADGFSYRFYSLVLYPVINPCSIDSIVIHPGSDPVYLTADISNRHAIGHASWRKLNPGSQLYLLNATLVLFHGPPYNPPFNASAMVEQWLAVPKPYVTVMCTERSPWNYVMAAAELTKMAQCPTKAEVPPFD